MQTATGITLLFVAATAILTAFSRLSHVRKGDIASIGGVIIATAMFVWCAIAGAYWLGWRL